MNLRLKMDGEKKGKKKEREKQRGRKLRGSGCREEQQIRIKIKMSGFLLFFVRLNQTLTEETLFEVCRQNRNVFIKETESFKLT